MKNTKKFIENFDMVPINGSGKCNLGGPVCTNGVCSIGSGECSEYSGVEVVRPVVGNTHAIYQFYPWLCGGWKLIGSLRNTRDSCDVLSLFAKFGNGCCNAQYLTFIESRCGIPILVPVKPVFDNCGGGNRRLCGGERIRFDDLGGCYYCVCIFDSCS